MGAFTRVVSSGRARWRRSGGSTAVAIAACALALSSCGQSGLSAADKSGIRAALARWAAATTPEQACAVMSSGFRFFVGKNDYSACAANIVATLGRLAPETMTVQSLREQDGQVAVRATVTGRPGAKGSGQTVYWFVWQRGAWRLNSIGIRVGLGPPCHTYPGHPC